MNMNGQTSRMRVERVDKDGGRSFLDDSVARESILRIVCNYQELSLSSYLPGMEREFTYGYLFGHGLIDSADDVLDWEFSPERDVVFAEIRRQMPKAVLDMSRKYLASGCGEGLQAMSIESLAPLRGPHAAVSAAAISEATGSVLRTSPLFRETGCAHSVALCRNDGGIIVCAEDIGRHNAFDKIVGHWLLDKRINIRECFATCTGRLSSEIVSKAWRAGIPLVASRAAPTSRAVELARIGDIALIGFVRAGRLNIYHGADRIK